MRSYVECDSDLAISSVCLFITPRYRVKTAKCIVEIASLRNSFIVVFFRTKRHHEILMGPNKGCKHRWVLKICHFQPISRCISEAVQDKLIVTIVSIEACRKQCCLSNHEYGLEWLLKVIPLVSERLLRCHWKAKHTVKILSPSDWTQTEPCSIRHSHRSPLNCDLKRKWI